MQLEHLAELAFSETSDPRTFEELPHSEVIGWIAAAQRVVDSLPQRVVAEWKRA